MRQGQTQRLATAFELRPNHEISAVELHRIGSGSEFGWCASLSRRISDLRKAGYHIVKTSDVRVGQHRLTRLHHGCVVRMKTPTLEPLIALCGKHRGLKADVLVAMFECGVPGNWSTLSGWLNPDPSKRRKPRPETLKRMLEIQASLVDLYKTKGGGA